MNIDGYRINKSDLRELLQQILIWLDYLSTQHFSPSAKGFVPNTDLLFIDIRSVITEDNQIVLTDIREDRRFFENCSNLASEIFIYFYRQYLIMPGQRCTFYLEKVYPNYAIRLTTADHTIIDLD